MERKTKMNDNHIADERKKVLETPERIFLVVGDLSDIDDPALFRNLDDVSWCEDQIDDHDIEYVRADLAAPIAPRADVPENVMLALDRMCTPLDESRLSGATAAADAHCMKLIRDYVLSATRADADTAGAFGIDDCIEALVDAKTLAEKFSARNQLDIAIARKVAAGASNERADAEKDAARYRAWLDMRGDYHWEDCTEFEVEEIIDAAILAAKEKK